MATRRIAIVLAVASLGLIPRPAFAQAADAPTPRAAPAPTARTAAKPRKAHAKKAAKPSAESAAASAAGSAPIGGGETEASSLERRRRAFFTAKPDEAAPDADATSAGVTLGGSGGLTPGMGFKF
ncbi:hypothetical protein [Lichenibacterium dinghuense]|uniref:hypothetical protein n=1 Tax=Lichenibacterium dinghuense TaxID=2895977 RepID=UPI00272E703C|nr:hypothetical protein [Lichenibacterium sp. 6Y81]